MTTTSCTPIKITLVQIILTQNPARQPVAELIQMFTIGFVQFADIGRFLWRNLKLFQQLYNWGWQLFLLRQLQEITAMSAITSP